MAIVAFSLFRWYTQWSPIEGHKWFFQISSQRKFIDWKKTKLFRFRWNWDEEKNLRGIRPPICLWRTVTLLHFVGGSGKDFVDTIIEVKLLYKGMRYNLFYEQN
jgi:hypothetical protein